MNFEDSFYGRPNTIRAYKSLFRNHINPHVGRDHDYTDTYIVRLIGKWKKKGLAQVTQVTLLRILVRYAEFLGKPKPNVTRFIRSINRSKQEAEVVAFSTDESAKLMETCKRLEPRFYPTLLLGLHAGLRRGEVFGLVSGDLDFIKGTIKVSKSYNGPTKSGKTRYVPMGAELLKSLMNFSTTGIGDKLFKLEDPNPKLRRICSHARIPELNFHALRHTYATLALEAGTSPKEVQTWLGHASLSTTINCYWHVVGVNADLSFLPGIRGDNK